MVVPRKPISPSDHFPGRIRTGRKNSEAANSDVFIRGIYKFTNVFHVME